MEKVIEVTICCPSREHLSADSWVKRYIDLSRIVGIEKVDEKLKYVAKTFTAYCDYGNLLLAYKDYNMVLKAWTEYINKQKE